MKIEQISITPKKWYDISFDDGETLKVNEDILVKHGLFKGKDISEREFLEIKESLSLSLGMHYAYRYLSYRMRSFWEMRHYLHEKGILEEQIEAVIERLETLKLLDDAHYAESFVRTQMRQKTVGPRAIAYKLKQRGIDSLTIEDALAEFSYEEQFEVAFSLAEKVFHRHLSKSFREALAKTRKSLMEKGFSSDLIQEVMDELDAQKDEEQEYENLKKVAERYWWRNRNRKPFEQKMKTKQSLYQKGFDFDLIEDVLRELESEEEDA